MKTQAHLQDKLTSNHPTLKLMGSFAAFLGLGLTLASCSSSKVTESDQMRTKLSQSTGLYCAIVTESGVRDISVALNIALAKNCDGSKPFTTSHYLTPSRDPEVLYCCSLAQNLKKESIQPAAKASEDEPKLTPSSTSEPETGKPPAVSQPTSKRSVTPAKQRVPASSQKRK